MKKQTQKMTMEQRVLKYIKDFGSITTWEAFSELGITRLSEYIRRIREYLNVGDEWVKTTNRYGDKVEYKKYFLVNEGAY